MENNENIDEFSLDISNNSARTATSKLLLGFVLLSIGTITIVISNEIASLFIPSTNSESAEAFYNSIKAIAAVSGGVLCLTGIALFLMYYLRHGLQLPPRKGFNNESLQSVNDEKLVILQQRIEVLSKKHSELLANIESDSISLNEEEREKLIIKIQSGLTDQASKDVLDSIEKRYSVDVKVKSQLQYLSSHYDNTTKRLKKEIEALSRRGNLNLIIGSMTAILGLAILGSMVFSGDFTLSRTDQVEDYFSYMAREFLPRLALVLLIEIFAYFFLKLYKSSLDGIKYFQNELTNIEAKFIGIEGALMSDDIGLKKSAIEGFVATERNFILKKGDSTIELEKVRVEAENLSAGLKSVSEIINAAKK